MIGQALGLIGIALRYFSVRNCIRNPMSTIAPENKIALSNHFARGYSKILDSEANVDCNIVELFLKMDRYAEAQTAMELDKFITYTTFDNIGTAFFSEPFGFIRAGHDIGRTLKNNIALSKGRRRTSLFRAIQSFIYHMIQHPEAWSKVRSEIDTAQARGLCLDPVITFNDAEQLPYFKACVKEALRIFSPTTMGLPRVVPKNGITIAGRLFREGTILSISPYVVHSSKEIWGADAQVWNPERWISGDSKDLERNWLVFSAGYMMCLGRHFAKMQISKIAASLVRDYDIRQVDPKNIWDYQANFTALTHSWPVYVKKRKLLQK
ncbi:hypothetical protein WAI453_013576 [Rhynchosporium graminicola]